MPAGAEHVEAMAWIAMIVLIVAAAGLAYLAIRPSPKIPVRFLSAAASVLLLIFAFITYRGGISPRELSAGNDGSASAESPGSTAP